MHIYNWYHSNAAVIHYVHEYRLQYTWHIPLDFYLPLLTPLCSPFWPLFTYLETLLAVTGSVHLGLRLLVNWPPLLNPFPNPSPLQIPRTRFIKRLIKATSWIRRLLSGTVRTNFPPLIKGDFFPCWMSLFPRRCFVPTDILSCRSFCHWTFWTFCPLDILSCWTFFPWTFCPSRYFFPWMFCPRTFGRRTFGCRTFCRWTFCLGTRLIPGATRLHNLWCYGKLIISQTEVGIPLSSQEY